MVYRVSYDERTTYTDFKVSSIKNHVEIMITENRTVIVERSTRGVFPISPTTLFLLHTHIIHYPLLPTTNTITTSTGTTTDSKQE